MLDIWIRQNFLPSQRDTVRESSNPNGRGTSPLWRSARWMAPSPPHYRGGGAIPSSNVVDVVTSGLRQKLGSQAGRLTTVRGVGYQMHGTVQ